jgi:hypothetical protein
MEEVLCRRCKRPLRNTRRRKNQIGRDCARLEKLQVIIDTFTPEQIEKAKEILDLGAFQKADNVYNILSSDGSQIYLTSSKQCTCTAGQYDKMCYHRVAVMMLDI